MKYDDILKHIGEFGYYQKRLYILLCLPAINVGCFMMGTVLLLFTPKHRCKIPGYDNDTWDIQSDQHQLLVDQYIPVRSDGGYDKCHLIQRLDLSHNSSDLSTNATRTKCFSWVYDESVFHSTFTTQANLVCDDAMKTSHAQMAFFGGVLVGDLIFGVLADMIGRKKTLYLASLLMMVSALVVTWMPEFYSFIFLEFLVGATSHGAFMICCVLGLELVGPSKRVWTGIVIHVFFSIGLIYLAGVGYFFRHWQYIQIAAAVPCVFYVFYWWLIPESPRWLLSKNRKDCAEKIIQKTAKVNKMNPPPNMLDEKTLEKNLSEGRLWHLFTSRVLFFRTLILFFNWMVVSMMYYGVTMHSGNLGGDFYLNFFLLGVVEIPGYAICICLLDRIGRKKLHFSCMMVGGIACLCTVFTVLYGGPELQPLTMTLSLLGKLFSSAAFGIIFVFSAEIFPTVVRNAGMGTSSCFARVGGMLAPYIAKSSELIEGDFAQAEPLVIFGAASIAAGLLCVLLPETFNQKLPDTIEEGERFGRQPVRTEWAVNVSAENGDPRISMLAESDDPESRL